MATKRSNGSRSNPETASNMASVMTASAASPFLLSQRMALEAARFWARRLHAYADQMETLARCSTPSDFAAAQTQFLERMRDDYAEESEAVGALIASQQQGVARAAQEGA